MSKHLKVVNNSQEAIEAEKTLEQPFTILNKETNEIILKGKDYADVTILIDDENNYHPEVPVLLNDISWIKGKRCLVKKTSDGVAICYLDENNSELFHDGTTPAKLDGSMGQWMTDLPEFNIECVEGEDDWAKLYISKDKEIGHKSRRVLLGVALSTLRGDKLWSAKHSLGSTSDTLTAVTTINLLNHHNYANALGVGFDVLDYESHCKLAYMFMAKYGSRDPLNMTLFGVGSGGTRILGTTSTLGNTDGKTNTSVNIFGVEDPYGRPDEMIGGINLYGPDGLYYIYDGFQPNRVPTVPYRTVIQTVPYGSGYITRMHYGEYADLIPAYLGGASDGRPSGTSNTFYCDFSSVRDYDWFTFLRNRGVVDYGGLFSLEYIAGTNNQSCSRIQYRGNITVIDDPQEFIALPTGF